MNTVKHKGNVLIYTIHRTERWWKVVGENLGYERAILVSDLRGQGDFCIVDDFYRAYRKHLAAGSVQSDVLDAAAVDDVIARCRVLRWLPRIGAAAMALAMADAFSLVLDATQPTAIVSFPIDRYISDVLDRVARARGVPFFELTPGVIPETSMLLYRGRLICGQETPSSEAVHSALSVIANPGYVPTYLPANSRYTRSRFLKVFGYFRLRGWAFKVISMAKRDPLNLHYVDAQAFLGHKPRLSDMSVVDMFDRDWHELLERTPRARILFIGLPLFPEASIDYWIEDRELIDYEKIVVDVATAFSNRGFVIMVKDHPLQFGFRRVALLHQLRDIPNVRLVPYDVTGSYLMNRSGSHFTTTGTLGLQSALAGLQSVVTKSYYSNPLDFHLLESTQGIANLPQQVLDAKVLDSEQLRERQYRIIENIVRGTIYEDLYSRNGFDGNPTPTIATMGRVLGDTMHRFGRERENWHRLG
jgi:hypothetical protein